MIKAAVRDPKTGRTLLMIGLSFGNLDRFRKKPGDTYIKVNGKELDLPTDVLIFSGKTEAHLADMMSELIGPETKVTISDKLKQ